MLIAGILPFILFVSAVTSEMDNIRGGPINYYHKLLIVSYHVLTTWSNIAFLGLSYILSCYIFAKIENELVKKRKRGMIESNYKNLISIPDFKADSEYIKYGLTENERNQSKEISVVKAYISISRPFTKNIGKWHLLRGELDSDSYASAMASYSQSVNQWNIAKSSFEQQESIRQSQERARGQMPVSRRFSAPKPKKPLQYNYVSYTDDYGTCESSVHHDLKITCSPTKFQTIENGEIEIDFNNFSESVHSLYAEVLNKVHDGRLKLEIYESQSFYKPIDSSKLIEILSAEIKKSLVSEVKKLMMEHDANPKILEYKSEISHNSKWFPIVVIVRKLKNESITYTVCDSIDPSLVIFR